MEVIIENTLEDYEAAGSLAGEILEKYYQKPKYSHPLRNFLKILLLLTILASGLILVPRYGLKTSIFYASALGLIIIIGLVLGRLSSQKQKTDDAWQKTLHFVFKPGQRSEYKIIDSGLLITTNEGTRRLLWEKIAVLAADRLSLVFGETTSRFHLIPRRIFPTAESYREFVETVKSRTTPL